MEPQFLQNLASDGLGVPQDAQSTDLNVAPHLMQCFAPAIISAPHFSQAPAIRCSGRDLGGANALGENTSDRITTSPIVAIFSWPISNSLGHSLSSRRLLNCSLSTKRRRDFRSPLSVGSAFRTLPIRIPWESTTCNPLRPSSLVRASFPATG